MKVISVVAHRLNNVFVFAGQPTLLAPLIYSAHFLCSLVSLPVSGLASFNAFFSLVSIKYGDVTRRTHEAFTLEAWPALSARLVP